ncbi:MAG: DUF3179 domain-containing protein [Thermodesulfobacteriota bacterium]|jgi:hypothetical protein|nr:DUF3179 domain-containing protein [Candidatus Dadabacteria bacterium]MCZ6528372.1 DUF3179 domain-containing protein [Candidatus Dadabacteria bacterium]
MRLSLTLALVILLAVPAWTQISKYNGFDISNSLIPKDDILSGGPPKDGIPAILHPKFEEANEAKWLNDDDLVSGFTYNGVKRAYPLRILVWHEAVNDRIGDLPFLVSYCPLCGSTLIFNREIGGKEYKFGISGLLYQSDVLFYDRETQSLWSQLEMKSVSGKMAGTDFIVLPSTLATWKEWREKYPDTLVLSRDTGFFRNYDRQPYSGYEESSTIMFPIKNKNNKFHPKEKVLVVLSGNRAKAYPFSELKKVKTPLKDKLGGKVIVIEFKDGDYVNATDISGNPVDSFVSYWFAWFTFKPDTLIFTSDK